MHFSGVTAALSALAIAAAIPGVSSMPSQQNAPAMMAKRNTGEAESCYMSENGEHGISEYTIEIEDCEAIVSSAKSLAGTGASYYWTLDAGLKGWHLARYRTCQLSVDTVSVSTGTWVGSIDVATMVDLAVSYDVDWSGGVNSTWGIEDCNSTTTDTGFGHPGNAIQWYVLYWGGAETEPAFFDQIDQDHVAYWGI